METRLIAYERAATLVEVTVWANRLFGQEVPDSPEYVIVKVVQFQFLFHPAGYYDAVLLVEVVERLSDEQVALTEAEIGPRTSAIGEF